MIARILAVAAWRTQYLELLRRIVEVELDWENLGPRIDAYRDLIEAHVVRDPFHGDRTRFRNALYGDEGSIRSFAEQRRRFILEHPSLAPDADDSSGRDASSEEGTSRGRDPR